MRQIAIRMSEDMLAEIDTIVAERHGEADRTAVMRELMAEGLARRAKRRARG